MWCQWRLPDFNLTFSIYTDVYLGGTWESPYVGGVSSGKQAWMQPIDSLLHLETRKIKGGKECALGIGRWPVVDGPM